MNCYHVNIPTGEIYFQGSGSDSISKVIFDTRYSVLIDSQKYYVVFSDDYFNPDKTYRGQMLHEGKYLGHTCGVSMNCQIMNNTIKIFGNRPDSAEYQKFTWAFVLKFILTKSSLDADALHLKATLVKNLESGKAYLLVARGGGGKTTLAKFLSENGFVVLSNTHCVVKHNHAWGINSWIRIRDRDGNERKEAPYLEHEADTDFQGIYIVDHNKNAYFDCRELNSELSFSFINEFGAGINNYDLKEEVFDYFGNNFFDKTSYFIKERQLLEGLIANNVIYYLTFDIFDNNCCNHIKQLFIEG